MDELTEKSLVYPSSPPKETLNGILVVVMNLPLGHTQVLSAPNRYGFGENTHVLGTPKKSTEFFNWKLDLITLHIFQPPPKKKNEGPRNLEASKNLCHLLGTNIFSTSLGHKLLNM